MSLMTKHNPRVTHGQNGTIARHSQAFSQNDKHKASFALSRYDWGASQLAACGRKSDCVLPSLFNLGRTAGFPFSAWVCFESDTSKGWWINAGRGCPRKASALDDAALALPGLGLPLVVDASPLPKPEEIAVPSPTLQAEGTSEGQGDRAYSSSVPMKCPVNSLGTSSPEATGTGDHPPPATPERSSLSQPSSLASSDCSVPERTHSTLNLDGLRKALMYGLPCELRDISGHVVELSKDRSGSRFIQGKLESASQEDKDAIFLEILPDAIPLMKDAFGNHVVQSVLERCDQIQRAQIFEKMRGSVWHLSTSKFGCRIVQKAFDFPDQQAKTMVIWELEKLFHQCSRDQNASFVIRKALKSCEPTDVRFIVLSLKKHVLYLACTQYGCRVVQRCLERSDADTRSQVTTQLMTGIKALISDRFGNYVVQHIIQNDRGNARRRIMATTFKLFHYYSRHKFASNVVETCLRNTSISWKLEIVDTLTRDFHKKPYSDKLLITMIKDAYGNYVIKTLLESLPRENRAFLLFYGVLHLAVSQAAQTGHTKQVTSVQKRMSELLPLSC